MPPFTEICAWAWSNGVRPLRQLREARSGRFSTPPQSIVERDADQLPFTDRYGDAAIGLPDWLGRILPCAFQQDLALRQPRDPACSPMAPRKKAERSTSSKVPWLLNSWGCPRS